MQSTGRHEPERHGLRHQGRRQHATERRSIGRDISVQQWTFSFRPFYERTNQQGRPRNRAAQQCDSRPPLLTPKSDTVRLLYISATELIVVSHSPLFPAPSFPLVILPRDTLGPADLIHEPYPSIDRLPHRRDEGRERRRPMSLGAHRGVQVQVQVQ